MKAAVIGHPISHSLSPAIFRFLRARELTPLEYEALDIHADKLASFIEGLRADPNWRGSNVTIPHKVSVISLLDDVSPEAQALGAVNVIQVKNGKLHGFNTDVVGIEKTFHFAGFSVRGKACLVFGAGGSAKAVAYVLGHSGAKSVTFYNPRSNRGVELAQKFQSLFPEVKFKTCSKLDELKDQELSLIVNTTPVGMNVQDFEFFAPIERLNVSPSALAFDLIYTPKDTQFLQVCWDCGIRGIGGLGMLIDQAIATWEVWVGTLRQADRMREELNQYLSGILKLREDPRPVFLTGFMGVGKSTIAHELSKGLGRSFSDTDRAIEKNTGLSVSDIFAREGEAGFRNREREAVELLCAQPGCIIALGGGVLTDPHNLKRIKESGTLIYLSATEATLNERLEKGARTRPLLANLNDQERATKIAELLKQRLPAYQQAALTVAVDGLNPSESAEKILMAIGGNR